MNKKISIYSLWRNSESYLDRTLSCLEEIENQKEFDITYYFYENDSIDNTKSKLHDWMKKRKGEFIEETLNAPSFGRVVDPKRFVYLSIFRNNLQDLSQNDTSELSLLIDSDVVFSLKDLKLMIDCNLSHGYKMIVANTRQNIPDLIEPNFNDSFYDVLPLRDSYNNDCLYFRDCPLPNNRDRMKWFLNEPIRIKSGFSGFSLINTDVLKKCRWSSFGLVEHINFCNEVNDFGQICILPTCRPKVIIEQSHIDIKSFSNSAKQQHNINEVKNKIFSESLSFM